MTNYSNITKNSGHLKTIIENKIFFLYTFREKQTHIQIKYKANSEIHITYHHKFIKLLENSRQITNIALQC